MNSLTGAERPVLKRKILWIAITAIVLVLAWARAGFPYPEFSNPYFYMGTDGTVDGMMPPNPQPKGTPPPTSAPTSAPNPHSNALMLMAAPIATPASTSTPSHGARPAFTALPVSLVSRVKITQKAGSHAYKYIAAREGNVYRITRDGAPWATLTYNKNSGYYELTDPNGTGDLLLRLGPKRPPGTSYNEPGS